MSEAALMPFPLDPSGVWRPRPPAGMEWLTLGFGTRLSEDWAPGVVRLKQIHSDRIVLTEGPWETEDLPEGDALITNRPGLMVGVRTADCLPILIADERTRCVAAVHAGWRGTASQIASRTVAELGRVFGSRPADLWVWLGPAIGKCCFEVGPEVAEQFRGFTGPPNPAGKVFLDLSGANIAQLTAAGVPGERIEPNRACTRCHSALFHSWRRDREAAGRMVAAIERTDQTN